MVISLVVILAFYFAWPTITEVEHRIIPTSILDSRTPLQKAKENYEKQHDLRSMLAYGREIDTVMVGMDSERAKLEKEFYLHLAKDAGDSVHVPWNYLYGLWMRESQMDPKARGDSRLDSAGHIIPGSFRAFGLGQEHLSTAREIDPNVTKEQLMDPMYSGYSTAKVLKKYTAMFGGNYRYGISAYQQGPEPTKAQYKKKARPANIDYVLDVYQFSAEALVEGNGNKP